MFCTSGTPIKALKNICSKKKLRIMEKTVNAVIALLSTVILTLLHYTGHTAQEATEFMISCTLFNLVINPLTMSLCTAILRVVFYLVYLEVALNPNPIYTCRECVTMMNGSIKYSVQFTCTLPGVGSSIHLFLCSWLQCSPTAHLKFGSAVDSNKRNDDNGKRV